MPWLQTDSAAFELEVAPATIAVLEHDAEIARTPAQDLSKLLEHLPYAVQRFDEHTFGGMFGSPSPFSAMVLGYNAVALSEPVRLRLEQDPPAVPLVLLHQLRPECYDFLAGRLALKAHALPRSVSRVELPAERQADDEPLLRFPRSVQVRGGYVQADAIRWFSFAPGSAWRVVLEARFGTRRYPVLLRTADVEEQRVVACSLLLEPRNPRHARLLENMLAYAAAGWPEIAVVELADETHAQADYGPEAITRKLRIQGARVMRLRARTRTDVDFGRWPLIGVRRVVFPRKAALGSGAAERWLAAGGVAVTVQPGNKLSVQAGADDTHWATQRWATWFLGCPPRHWQTSLFASRAVLRMLNALDEPGLGTRFAVSSRPADFARPISALLRARLRHGSVEQTISATAAAMDLHNLVGGVLPKLQEVELRRWLTGQFAAASLADQLDIARCLGDAHLLARALAAQADDSRRAARLPTLTEARGLSAVEATRLREAWLACHPLPLPELPAHVVAALKGERQTEDLRGALRCAELLEPWLRCRRAAPQHALSDLSTEAEAAALDGLAGSTALTEDGPAADSNGHDLTVQTLAVLRWLQEEPGAALQMRPQSRELPIKAVAGLLGEVERARDEEQKARRDVPALGAAVLGLGAVAVAAAALALLGVLGLASVQVTGGTAIAAGGALGAALLGVVGVRHVALRPARLEHPERRDLVFAQLLLTLLVVASVAAAVIHLWKQAQVLGVGLLILAVGAGVAVAALQGLRRIELAPEWAPSVVGIFGAPNALLEFMRKRDERRSSPAPAEVPVGEARGVQPPVQGSAAAQGR